jgi:hypothetical protein
MTKRDNLVKNTIVSIFVGLYALVSCISTIHVIDFFRLSNPEWLAITLAIAFEIGAAACLGAIVILDKTSRWLVWTLFILITGMQMMGNMYYAYTHLIEYKNWSELFGLTEEDPIYQKRILSFVSGGILPIVALGFIKSLVDYIRPTKAEVIEEKIDEIKATRQAEENLQTEIAQEIIQESIDPILIEEDEEIAKIESDDTISEEEKKKKIERKIKQVISENPELKEKITEKLKEIEEGDKYSKTGTRSNAPMVERRVFGGM